MSQSSTHALSTRLFIQAAFTGFFALTPAYSGRSGWMTIAIGLAGLTVAVGFLVRSGVSNGRSIIIGLEALVLVVFVAGVRDHYWMPGTILGIVTLIAALNTPRPVTGCAATDTSWAPPAGVVQAPPGYGPPMAVGPPAGAPVMGNPYAPPAPPAPFAAPVMGNPYAPPAPPAPVWAPPSPAPVEAVVPVQPPAPVEPIAPPARPEDVPPAPRSMTILPGG